MALYSKDNQYPTELPFRITLSNGRTRTDPRTFTPDEITDAGYVLVSNPPIALSNQVVQWVVAEGDWVIREKTISEKRDDRRRIEDRINSERNKRILLGFEYSNVIYDCTLEDQKNISAAALLALMAVMEGANTSNYYWHGGTAEFAWVAQNNMIVPMSAPEVISFGKTAMTHVRSHIFAARTLKDSVPIPSDYTNDSYWPPNFIA